MLASTALSHLTVIDLTRVRAGPTAVRQLADQLEQRPVPRAVLPKIRLQSPKITRALTTEWFARRVDERFRGCLARVERARAAS